MDEYMREVAAGAVAHHRELAPIAVQAMPFEDDAGDDELLQATCGGDRDLFDWLSRVLGLAHG
jgi:hypothetical protein